MSTSKILARIKNLFKEKSSGPSALSSRVLDTVPSQKIDPHAASILNRLSQAGFAAYLVGGSVRDLLLRKSPKDFDLATNATPEEIRKLFRNSRIIGRRFRLVHVFFSGENIEVSTFRANSGDLQDENVYGTVEEDAWRRDFTVNALYYNLVDKKVLDFTDGLSDLKAGVIRMIGDPVQRYHEDPVRMLRAVRLAAKLDFTIEEKTAEPIGALLHLLTHVPGARFFDETLKLFFEGHAEQTYLALQQYHLLPAVFPQTAEILKNPGKHHENLILLALKATDERYHNGRSLNPGFLLSVFLWPVFEEKMAEYTRQKKRFFHALDLAITGVIEDQCETLKMPRRLTAMIRSIWLLQFYLQKRRPNRVQRVLSDRYFRAAYDLLELRVINGEKFGPVFDWWRKLRSVNVHEQVKMIEGLNERK